MKAHIFSPLAAAIQRLRKQLEHDRLKPFGNFVSELNMFVFGFAVCQLVPVRAQGIVIITGICITYFFSLAHRRLVVSRIETVEKEIKRIVDEQAKEKAG